MTNENILDAIGGINDEAVQDAKVYRDTGVHHFRRIPIVLIAAIIALLLMEWLQLRPSMALIFKAGLPANGRHLPDSL